MGFLVSAIRVVLVAASLISVSTMPTGPSDTTNYFSSRLIFFVMLLVDYMNVAYFNRGVERFIGIIGSIFVLVITFFELLGLQEYLLLDFSKDKIYFVGNSTNFITQYIDLNLNIYNQFVFYGIIMLLGIEAVNKVYRGRNTQVPSEEEEAA